ncbi:alkaline phosphatase family protein [Natrialbaceae archaeon A-CW2]|uniref:alkaline phosphatase family protein n=1 Tax=Natronosalvus amylolyticus TaxID=2961994 RepID=UPI0020C9D733|nr:alkaline phosphatase family protein [Natronosalvus amylolyticus]
MVTTENTTTKTVVIGLDALDSRYLERFEASMPNISSLRDRGIEAALESTHPPWTGSAWPSMYTGCDPSHHGVYGFFRYDTYPDEGELVSRGDVDRPAIWDYLSDEGTPSVVLNVPVTHPADRIAGVLIPGYLAGEDADGHPKGVREALDDELGEPYRIYSSHEVSDDSEKKLAGYLELIDQRRRAACSLVEREDWEFAFVQVQKTDAVFHNFDDDEAFRSIYEAADRLVGDILEAVDETVNVIVCSDHGIGPVTGYSIYVNEILRQHDYVVAADGEGGRTNLSSVKTSLTDPDTNQPAGSGTANSIGEQPSISSRAAKWLVDRLGIRPGSVYGAAERIGLESTLLRLTPDSLVASVSETVDWRESKAYCTEGTRLGIRINLEGREPNGIVSPEEYETVRDDLISILSSFETPDGKPAFDMVCRREALYDGPHADRAPDILFRPTDMNNNIKVELYGRTTVPIDVYDHKLDGVFLAAGPGIDGTWSGDRLSLTDVAPITMSLLGYPVPDSMTGTAPSSLLTVPVRSERYDPIDYGTTAVPNVDTEGVTNRLEDLGYL